jgi:hypothetical protein
VIYRSKHGRHSCIPLNRLRLYPVGRGKQRP